MLQREQLTARAGPDPSMVIDLIGGNLWFRTLVRDDAVDDDYLARLVDSVVAGVGVTPGGS
ncbi:TetR/AcrR family transcriptional regulator C-terminal ligand-binding domain-containing protein [Gordonia phthalatica]|uniref:Tetracyclin repressor-like C-terminal domain-containing protein n=1 Tax=Gordonia phthalatica TaxID=1136941 RepID=A0A0N9N2N5_9ACTN|nr:hypothetical protein [Gordonia phthalatica]ALG84508.1 hypothetical protein ACH46_08355 [Gordonia phthalatica]